MAALGTQDKANGVAAPAEKAHIAQSAERVLGKDEVIGSIPIVSTNSRVVGQPAAHTETKIAEEDDQWPKRSSNAPSRM